jgi:hypothetical protein
LEQIKIKPSGDILSPLLTSLCASQINKTTIFSGKKTRKRKLIWGAPFCLVCDYYEDCCFW